MVDQDNKDKIESPEKPAVEQGTPEHIKAEVEKVPDKKEVLHDDPQVLAELRREMDLMLLEPGNEKAVEVEKEKLDYLGEKEKI